MFVGKVEINTFVQNPTFIMGLRLPGVCLPSLNTCFIAELAQCVARGPARCKDCNDLKAAASAAELQILIISIEIYDFTIFSISGLGPRPIFKYVHVFVNQYFNEFHVFS